MNWFVRSLIAPVVLAGLSTAASAKEIYQFDPSGSTIGFSVHQFLGTTRGKFSNFSGRIEVDREHPENSSVTAQIDVRSIDTRIKKRDDHLRSAELFNVEKFPNMTFKSRSVKRTGTAKRRYSWRPHHAWRDESGHASCETADAG